MLDPEAPAIAVHRLTLTHATGRPVDAVCIELPTRHVAEHNSRVDDLSGKG